VHTKIGNFIVIIYKITYDVPSGALNPTCYCSMVFGTVP